MNAHRTPVYFENAGAPEPASAVTLIELVQLWARRRPAHRAYVYVTERSEQSLTYEELDRRAVAIAGWLRARVEPGARVLLLFPLGLDFVTAFFGCLYAGVIAVPLHPGRGKAAKSRLQLVARDSGASLALTTSAVAAELGDGASAHAGCELCVVDRITDETESIGPLASYVPLLDTVAFLQYTSGSTSEPKGTVVRHRNVLANLRMIESAFHTHASSVIVSWLPVFHDMGLIGSVLQAAYVGATAVLVSTLGFIRSPILWLRTIQRYGADCSGGPNFAYDLCVDKTTPEERAGLELGSWRVAFNGAEPVRARTLERFAAAFAPFGFEKAALCPTYGLAEATLVVAGSSGKGPTYFRADGAALRRHGLEPARDERSAQILVGNGRYDHGDQIVAIVDPDSGRRCSDSELGEIWVSGSHVASGYWQNEVATARTFGARLAGDARRYLRTGDLGFFRDSSLFVTGRLKDLVIFRGQNVYPQDIELTLELALPELRRGATAAFANDDDAGVAVVAELERGAPPHLAELARVARHVQETHEVPLRHLVLVRRNTVPKTTSGKIQRQRCKDEYERGEYDALAEWHNDAGESRAALARRIRAHAADWVAREQAIPRESIEDTAPLTGYGVDSIRKVALVSALELGLGLVIDDSSFFAIDTIDDIARHATEARTEAPVENTEPGRDGEQAGRASNSVFPAFSSINWESNDD